jgi:hypothetical protein
LANPLRSADNTVEMVGEFTSGTGADNYEQGTDGAEIA